MFLVLFCFRHLPTAAAPDPHSATKKMKESKVKQPTHYSCTEKLDKMLSARFELAIFRVSGERINQLSHESEPHYWLTCLYAIA